MENQQRSLDNRLHWLGGIIDGEGMITLIKRVGKNQDGYTPRISIVNTDISIINEASLIFKKMSLPHFIQEREGTGSWKKKYEIIIGGIQRCRRVIPHIIPVLIAKKNKAILLSEYCESRMSGKFRSPITTRQHEIAKIIRVGHTTGPQSNTPRDYTPNTNLVMI